MLISQCQQKNIPGHTYKDPTNQLPAKNVWPSTGLIRCKKGINIKPPASIHTPINIIQERTYNILSICLVLIVISIIVYF